MTNQLSFAEEASDQSYMIGSGNFISFQQSQISKTISSCELEATLLVQDTNTDDYVDGAAETWVSAFDKATGALTIEYS